LHELESAYYELEPFLGGGRDDAARKMLAFEKYCVELESKNLAEMSEEETSEVSRSRLINIS
jgi:hypothetical protein